jgi:hypothetical protein
MLVSSDINPKRGNFNSAKKDKLLTGAFCSNSGTSLRFSELLGKNEQIFTPTQPKVAQPGNWRWFNPGAQLFDG